MKAEGGATRSRIRLMHGLIAVVIFLVEVAIARGIIPGAFVRSSIGDVLVIPLLYFTIRALTGARPALAVGLSLGAGLVVELLQGVHAAERLGFAEGSAPYVAMGNTFSWSDLVMYGIGGMLALWTDTRMLSRRS